MVYSERDTTQKDTSSSAVTSSLSDLIARLEKAMGPDRELDVLIGYAVDLRGDDKHLSFRTSFDTCGMKMMLEMAESYQNIWRTELPRFTSSIDAAMTLVPEGWNRRASETDKHWWWAELREGHETSYNRVEIGQSPSLPVSICIAALKARSLPAI